MTPRWTNHRDDKEDEDPPTPEAPQRILLSMYVQRAEEYEALLSEKVTKSSKRAKLMSVQGVLFGFTFMMSTFETSNR